MPVESTYVSTRTNRDHKGADFWQQHINAFKRAKLSRRAYCRQHDLVEHRFKYQLNKFSEKAPTIKAIPIALKHFNQSQALCTLTLASDKLLVIYDQSVLNAVLSRLL